MSTIEMRLRTFFTCDEAHIVLVTSVTIDSREIRIVPWAETIEKLLKQLGSQLESGPFTHLREMTADEVEEYLAAEKADEEAG